MQHLLIACPFSRQVWHDTLAWLRIPCRPPEDETDLQDWWSAARQLTPKPMRKGLATATHLVAWMIWKQRNSCVFDGARPSVPQLTASIREEAALWARAGAKGLRVIIPTNWDVH
uniref:Uncharacterized protein n=1 Tax=Avena sativa TaxID=4498 RepID=A0ACD5ULI8_AVESA